MSKIVKLNTNKEAILDHVEVKEKTPTLWQSHIKEVMYGSDEIQERVKELALEISKHYQENELKDSQEEILVVGLLSGAVAFMTDLIRYLKVPYRCDYLDLSSYGDSTTSSGTVKMRKDLTENPYSAGKHILIVEDIVDSGTTMNWLINFLASKNCKSVKVATLLDKKARRIKDLKVQIDYVGFDCEDVFIIGYGLDYKQRYRGLPFIGVLNEFVYKDS